jgi:hypothetical protein
VLVVSGCGGADARAQAASAAATSFSAMATSDAASACRMLAPDARRSLEEQGPSCADALAAEKLEPLQSVTSVVVAGQSAQVRDATGDTVFLALVDQGWRVTAAGCHQVSDDLRVPYDCDVEG